MNTITNTPSTSPASPVVSEDSSSPLPPDASSSHLLGPTVTATINPFVAAMANSPDDDEASMLAPGNLSASPSTVANSPTSSAPNAPTSVAPGDDGTTDASPSATAPQELLEYHSAPVQPQPKNLPEPLAIDFDSRDEGLNFEKDQLAEQIPTYHQQAAAYMKQFVKDKFGVDIDPDTTYVNEYEPITQDVPSMAGNKFPPTKKEVGVGKLIRSTPLSKIAYGNLYQLISSDTHRFHISTSNDPNQSAANETDVIDPHAFYDAIKDHLDFKTYYSDKIDQFYKFNHDAMCDIARTEANIGIDKQLATGQLDKESYALAKRAINPDPDDKDPPKVYPFEVNGYQSNDGLVIVGKDRTLAYLRGEKAPITVLNDPKGVMKNFGYGYPFDQATLPEFTYRHFSQNDAGGRSDGSGVQAALGPDSASAWGQLTHSFSNWRNDPFSDDKEMHQDPFGGLLAINQRHDKEDANFDITSNGDVLSKKINRLTDYFPVPYIAGPMKLFTAKTQTQKGEGAFYLAFDATNAGLSKIHPRLGHAAGHGTLAYQFKDKASQQPPSDQADNPNDFDDPNNSDNMLLVWNAYPVNNFSRSYEMPATDAPDAAQASASASSTETNIAAGSTPT